MTHHLDLDTLVLYAGSHEPGGHMCFMEAAAYFAGEPWSSRPACVSSILSAFGRAWNDVLDHRNRQRLRPFIPKVVGTAGDGAADQARLWMLTDWLARVCAPAFLRATGLFIRAGQLEQAAPITDPDSAATIQSVLNNASQAAVLTDAPDTPLATALAAALEKGWDARTGRRAASDATLDVRAGRTGTWIASWSGMTAQPELLEQALTDPDSAARLQAALNDASQAADQAAALAAAALYDAWDAAWYTSREALQAASRVAAKAAVSNAGWNAGGARAAAWGSWDACNAWDAAWEAAWDARSIRASAYDASRNAWAATWDTAWGMSQEVWDAVWTAADARLEPTVAALQKSAFDLLGRLCDAGNVEAASRSSL